MPHISSSALEWSVERLNQWRESLRKAAESDSPVPRPAKNVFRFFLLKFLGVKQGSWSTAKTTSDFQKVCSRFLQVSFQDDSTAASTDSWPHYFVPFTSEYQKATGNSDYAVGTMWTRCQTWKDHKIIDFQQNNGNTRRLQFTSNYVELIGNTLSHTPIPALALAAFLFRRPTDAFAPDGTVTDPRQAQLIAVSNATQLLNFFKSTFAISSPLEDPLFDYTLDGFPTDGLVPTEMKREQILQDLQKIAPFTGDDDSGGTTTGAGLPAAPTAPPLVVGVNWTAVPPNQQMPCDLVGMGETFSQVLAALRSGKHVVLIGAPGTGKTDLAECVCKTLAVEYDIVTATSDWTTFDTVGGYLPDPDFAVPGTPEPLNFIPAAVSRSLLKPGWLVIDEINRADIDKSFGELFTLLSGKTVKLPFKMRVREGDKVFLRDVVLGTPKASEANVFPIHVPPDWRIIGTMNTFDKASLFQLSFAFMRRFAFIDIDVPKQADYENLLTTYVSDPRKLGQDVAKPYWTGCLTALKNLLRQDGKDKDTLYELGLLVGPAIPLDMLKYLNQRMPSPDDADVTRFVLEALEMFLFPQFEGKDEEHPKIHDAVVNALGLKKADDLARTESRLRNWTGNEPDGV